MLQAIDAKGWQLVPSDSKETSLLKLPRVICPKETIAFLKLGSDTLKCRDKVLGLLSDNGLAEINKDSDKGHASRFRKLE